MKHLFLLLAVGLLAYAGMLRFSGLDVRPMHGDEANQGIRFGQLLETGVYEYSSTDHHGPTMYYLSLPAAWLTGAKTTADLTEGHLRGTIAVFGLIGVGLTLLLIGVIGRSGAMAAMILAATSPALVFHSRYFIQETILAVLTCGALAAAYGFWRKPGPMWASVFGGLVGFSAATKETAVLAIAAAVGAIAVMALRRPQLRSKIKEICGLRNIAACIGGALFVFVVFLSSFFSNPSGPVDYLKSYTGYVDRGLGGEAQAVDDTSGAAHAHPPLFFAKRLIGDWTQRGAMRGLKRNTPARPMTELPLLLFATVGAVLAWRRKQSFVGYAALFGGSLFVVYSVIPYKTPWCILSCLYLALVPAGYAVFCGWKRSRAWRVVLGILLAVVAADNFRQTRLAADRMSADRRNPWVYAHPVSDVKALAAAVCERAEASGETVAVVCADPWPLPWYFRKLSNVGYWESPPATGDVPPGSVLWVVDTRHEAFVGSLAGDNYPTINGLRQDTLMATIPASVDEE